jgi:hypothetical protein
MVYNSISKKIVKEISEISPKSCGLNHSYELIITESDIVSLDDLLKVAVGERGIYRILVYIGNLQPNKKLDYIIAGLLGRRHVFLSYLSPKVKGKIHSYEEVIEKDKDGSLIDNMRINVVGNDNNEDILIEKTVSGRYYINYSHLKLPSKEEDLRSMEKTLKCIEDNIEEYLKRSFGISEISGSYSSELDNFLSIRLRTELIGERTSISPIISYDKIKIEISLQIRKKGNIIFIYSITHLQNQIKKKVKLLNLPLFLIKNIDTYLDITNYYYLFYYIKKSCNLCSG